jgi:hypothetical protein
MAPVKERRIKGRHGDSFCGEIPQRMAQALDVRRFSE